MQSSCAAQVLHYRTGAHMIVEALDIIIIYILYYKIIAFLAIAIGISPLMYCTYPHCGYNNAWNVFFFY